MKLKLISFLVLALSFTSCSIWDGDPIQHQIIGHWEWVQSTGGFGGWTITPDSSGYSKRQITYTPDQKFSYSRADTIVTSGFYSLKKKNGDILISYKTTNDRFFSNQRLEFESKDTLILHDRCADCYTSTYRRKN